jgi:hypothetical protein
MAERVLAASRWRNLPAKLHRHRGYVLTLLCLGLLGEPLGHALAYVVRLGLSRALIVQGEGTHAYFPRLIGASLGLLVLVLAVSLLAAVAVRVALGRRPAVRLANWWPAFLFLVAIQSGAFLVQESLEATGSQQTPDFLVIAGLSLAGQLPIAVLTAWLVSTLRGYVALAPRAVRIMLARWLARPPEPVRLASTPVFVPSSSVAVCRCYLRRAPPLAL